MSAASVSGAERAAMRRSLELAARGPAYGPNPQVGCVLLDAAGTTVAEGWHLGSGTPHAEVVALSSLRASGGEAAGLTAVVTLEPCSHTGKTGPCAVALAEAGIARVLYAVTDPGAESGGGAAILMGSGVDVVGGVEESEGRTLIERWFFATQHQRPWTTVKWAMSLDGRAAATDGTSQWITSPDTRGQVHLDRSLHDAIAVGSGTVKADNPSLTARGPGGTLYEHQPMAVAIGDSDVPPGATIREHPGGFYHHQSRDLQSLGHTLFGKGMRSLYVEGGPTLASAFLAAGLVDEVHVSMGPMLLGGPKTAVGDLGITTMAEAMYLEIRDVLRFQDDLMVVARVQHEGEK